MQKRILLLAIAATMESQIAAGSGMVAVEPVKQPAAQYRFDLSDTFHPKLVLEVQGAISTRTIGGTFYFHCRKGNLQEINITAIFQSELAASLYDQYKDWAIGFSSVASSVFGSAPGVEKEAGLQHMDFEHTLELSATTTKSFDYTAISSQPDVLYLSGYMEVGEFQQWISRPIVETLFYDQSKKQWWVFTKSQTTIAQDDVQQFLRACVG